MTAVRMERSGRDPVDIDALLAENAKLKDYLKRVLVTLEEHQSEMDRRPVAGERLVAVEHSLARIEQDLQIMIQYVRGRGRPRMTAVD